jgi:hypothetical protein
MRFEAPPRSGNQPLRAIFLIVLLVVVMTDVPGAGPLQPQGVPMSIIDTWKLKLPSIYLFLPSELINHVGGVVVAWGVFEQVFSDFLDVMMAETGNSYKGLRFLSFEQKCGIFRLEMAKCFFGNSDLLARLSQLLDDSLPLQVKRNVLVHGQISLKIDHDVTSIVAKGEHKKREVVEVFTKDAIDDLYYEIIHAAGRMAQVRSPDRAPFVPPLALPDISRLQDVLSRNPHPHSTISMIAHPPPPSPG